MDPDQTDSTGPSGPVMLAATRVLNPGQPRISRIGAGITLPRTVPILNLVVGGAAALIGAVVGASISTSLEGFIYGAVFFAAAALFALSYSPLEGESMLKWFQLLLGRQLTAGNETRINGQRARICIGICPAPTPANGKVKVVPGAINIAPGQFDERGALISAKNGNLDRLERFTTPKAAPTQPPSSS